MLACVTALFNKLLFFAIWMEEYMACIGFGEAFSWKAATKKTEKVGFNV
jgi:hypothetical protein